MSCGSNEKFISSNIVSYENIAFDINNLVLLDYTSDYMVKSSEYVKDTIEWRGIDSYTCYSRDSTLEINFSYGLMSNGQGLNLMVEKDSVSAKLYNWSDGARGESFDYNIKELELTLSNKDYLNRDTIIGRLSIKGEENIESTKEDHIILREIDDWKEFENSYFKTQVSIVGEFKLIRVKYFSDGGQREWNRSNLYRQKVYYNHLAYVTSNVTDSLNAKRMNWKVIPKEVLTLTQLKILNLQGNKLIDTDFGCLKPMNNLTKLDLRWNRLKYFPKTVLKNKNLNHLNLLGNPIEDIPIDELLKSKIEYLNMKGSKIDTSRLDELRKRMIIEI